MNLKIIFIDSICSVPFLNANTELSPEISELLDSFDKMPSPRMFKSHLPFYLLHPELLDTSKVHLTDFISKRLIVCPEIIFLLGIYKTGGLRRPES